MHDIMGYMTGFISRVIELVG